MGPTLNITAVSAGYTLSDRATWANLNNRQELDVLLKGDPVLFNGDASLLVNPTKGAHIEAANARAWHEWLTFEEGRKAISSLQIRDQQPFFPSGNAPRP